VVFGVVVMMVYRCGVCYDLGVGIVIVMKNLIHMICGSAPGASHCWRNGVGWD